MKQCKDCQHYDAKSSCSKGIKVQWLAGLIFCKDFKKKEGKNAD